MRERGGEGERDESGGRGRMVDEDKWGRDSGVKELKNSYRMKTLTVWTNILKSVQILAQCDVLFVCSAVLFLSKEKSWI